MALRLDCSTAALTTPQKVLPIWKLVEHKMLDFSDRTGTGILILLSSATTLTTPHKVLPIWKLVELQMLDFGDHSRTSITIVTSAADHTTNELVTPHWSDKVFFTGGFNLYSNPEDFYSSTEIFVTDATEYGFKEGPELLQETLNHCMVRLNETHSLLTGGEGLTFEPQVKLPVRSPIPWGLTLKSVP